MSFYHPLKDFEFSGTTLVVPVVSVANIAQLAADLLISSLSLQRIGVFDAQTLIPVVGPREDGEEGITTPLELFGKEGLNVAVIQQRSPPLRSRKIEFVDSLLAFARQYRFAAVLFLSGVDLSHRTDAQMLTSIYQVVPPDAPSLKSTPLDNLTNLPIPAYSLPLPQRPKPIAGDTDIPFIPGGGLTRRILSSLGPGWPLPVAALLQFALEGDNRADAHMFANVVAKVLGVDSAVKEWKQPGSWMRGLFGAPPDQTLYG